MEKFFNPEKPREEKLASEPKIIGNAPEFVKKDFQEKYKEYLRDENVMDISREQLEMIKSIECEKTAEEMELIKSADDELNEIIKKFGVEPFDVPPQNIHIFDSDLYEKKGLRHMGIGGSAGFYNVKERFVGIPSEGRDDLLDFGGVVFHEINHLKGYHTFKIDKINKIEAEEEKKGNKIEAEDDLSTSYLIKSFIKESLGLTKKSIESPKTTGKTMTSREAHKWIDEYHKENLRKSLKELGKTPIEKEPDVNINIYRSGLRVIATEEKVARLEKQGEEAGKEIERGYFTFLDEAVVAEMEGRYRKKLLDNPIIKKHFNIENENVAQVEEEHLSAEFKIASGGGYNGPREALEMLISGIYERNKDKFKSGNEVFNIFVKARYTGQLLPMSRLIIDTFGKDVFDKVAVMSYSASEVVDAIKIVELKKRLENLQKN